ncbi:WD40 repeat-like protein [Serendipita vermifera]|nr:WD40 repeat-like protein [Serendipita vermifera]
MNSESMDYEEDLYTILGGSNTKSTLHIKPSKKYKKPLPPIYVSHNPLQSLDAAAIPYVTHLLGLSTYQVVAAFSTPSDSFGLLAITQSHLTPLRFFAGHQQGITDLKPTPTEQSHGITFWSCGIDGLVKYFDTRLDGKESMILKASPNQQEIFLSLDISANANMVAAGTERRNEEAIIVYWDPRNPSQPVHTHTSTHSEDVTCLAFKPTLTDSNLILSGSSDGLVCISDSHQSDEDEACLHVANTGASIARVGWMNLTGSNNPKVPRVWSASDMETMSIWSNDLDPVYDYGDVRSASTEAWETDYIISSRWLGAKNSLGKGGLLTWCGDNSGRLSLMRHNTHSWKKWKMEAVLEGAHTEIVRCVCWNEEGLVVSGGEDGRIALWQVGKNRMSGLESHIKEDTEEEIEEEDDDDMEVEGVPTNPAPGRRRRESAGDDDIKVTKKVKRED